MLRLILGASFLLIALSACAPANPVIPVQNSPSPAEPFVWRSFLEGYSQDLLSDPDVRARIPIEQQGTGWLGYEGASEGDIAALEARLGLLLPPSYREFLQTTNGWRQAGPFIDRLYSTAEVDWFRVHNREWISAYTVGSLPGFAPSVADEKYFVYGPEQDSVDGRWEYLEDALEISPGGDSTIYLLNPKVIFEDGEWEAWFFANWLPGATRFRSFREMMQAERQLLLDRRETGD